MILQKDNLTLQPMVNEHAEFYIQLLNIPEVSNRINRPLPFTYEDFEKDLKHANNPDCFVWIIRAKEELCGVINSAVRQGTNGKIYQFGYWVHPDYTGRGIATKASIMVRDFLIDKGAERIQALVEPDNLASIKVLEKSGYKKEGLLRKYYPILRKGLVDVFIFSYLA